MKSIQPVVQRQGDILIIAAEHLPGDALHQGHHVLAEGEATGHRHELDGGDLYESSGEYFFIVPQDMEVTLTHPEHQQLVFAPGTYRVVRQREYEPGGWRHVAD